MFACDGADFTVRSLPDGDLFRVRRECLIQGSEVLRDMFSCCDTAHHHTSISTPDDSGNIQVVDLHEPASQLYILLNFLHHPPNCLVSLEKDKTEDSTRIIQNTVPEGAIPFPLLRVLFSLADKYAFSNELMDCLHSHLAAYSSTYPLRVYGHAVELGLEKVAADASMYLLYPPLTTYSAEEVRVIPTAEAYHKLLLLHDIRVKKLRDLLEDAEIFPYGFGKCVRHAYRTEALWESRKRAVIGDVQAATDVAAEMVVVVRELADCKMCASACTAAIAMLGYKCGKLPRRIDQIPT